MNQPKQGLWTDAVNVDELLAREAIRHTMARYTMAGDRLRTDEFIAVFTEDAVLASEGVAESDVFRYQGREAIREWISRWSRRSGGSQAPGATFVRHHLSSSLIELTGPNMAKARTYWVAYTDIGADHCGYYLDVFRKTDEGWLIAERKVRLDWRSPNSLFTTAIRDTSSRP
ncbi:MAG: nuclear transport factor 2 family protein [Steroidobacteraceae bacterium]